MSLLRRVLAASPPPWSTDPSHSFWFNPVPSRTASGEVVNDDTALSISTFYRCIRVIAEGVAKLPLKFYRRTGEGKARADEYPSAHLFRTTVNPRMTVKEWVEMMTGHLLARGNGYSRILPGARGFADTLEPLDVRFVRPILLTSGRLRYEEKVPGREPRTFHQEEIFHLRGPGDGVEGWSMVRIMRETLGIARAAEGMGAEQFGRAPVMSGFLKTDEGVKLDPDLQTKTGEALRAAHAGPGRRFGVPVFQGLSWQSMGMSNEDAQFLETRRFQREEIATFFGVPFYKVGIRDDARVSSIEQQGIQFVVDCLMPWIVLWEQSVARDFILPADRDQVFAEFLLAALLRGTTKERFEAYSIATGNRAWMSPDEVRAAENMNTMGGELAEVREGLGSTRTDPAEGAGAPSAPPPAEDDDEDPEAAASRNGKPRRRRRPPVNRLSGAGA